MKQSDLQLLHNRFHHKEVSSEIFRLFLQPVLQEIPHHELEFLHYPSSQDLQYRGLPELHKCFLHNQVLKVMVKVRNGQDDRVSKSQIPNDPYQF